jgi:uncharacterized membrane protein YoaK (UPF0700 family)
MPAVSWTRDRASPAGSARTAPDDLESAARLRDRTVVALAMVSGATDAVGFLALGSAFTSVMTGNMVLVGIAAGTHDRSALGIVATAIATYVVGVAVGTRVAGQPAEDDGPWPPAVTRALFVELALLSAYAVGWWSLGSEPPHAWFAPLIALNAAALGVQSSAILRFGVSGLSTTYLTGTLTSVVVRLVSGQPLQTVGHPARILAGLVLGAATGAALATYLRPAAPAFQLVMLIGAIVAGSRAARRGTGPRERP